MKLFGKVLFVAALLVVLTAGVALAVTKTCKDIPCLGSSNEDTLTGTKGDGDGQDVIFGLQDEDELIGKSAADQLYGGGGDDTLDGGGGNDTLDGGAGNDTIFMGSGFDFVYADDGERDTIDCNDEGGGVILFDDSDVFRNCGEFDVSAASEQPSAATVEDTTSQDNGGSSTPKRAESTK